MRVIARGPVNAAYTAEVATRAHAAHAATGKAFADARTVVSATTTATRTAFADAADAANDAS